MAPADRQQSGVLGPAALYREGAAPGEAAAGRWIDRARRLASDEIAGLEGVPGGPGRHGGGDERPVT